VFEVVKIPDRLQGNVIEKTRIWALEHAPFQDVCPDVQGQLSEDLDVITIIAEIGECLEPECRRIVWRDFIVGTQINI
jgi:hypothetical protein